MIDLTGSATYRALEFSLRARIPLVALVTHEEARAEQRFLKPLADAWRGGELYLWSCTRGFESYPGPDGSVAQRYSAPDPHSALEFVAGYDQPALFVLRDFHHYLDNPSVVRRIRDLARSLPHSGSQIVFLGPGFSAPDDLEKDVELVDLPPPGREELSELLCSVSTALGAAATADLTPEGRERLLRGAFGLTLGEAEAAFARMLVAHGGLTDAGLSHLLDEKRQIIRRSGILEFCNSEEGLEDVGGLSGLKQWLQRREAAFTEEAKEFGLPAPRGVLILGIQGCGKSLTARALSRQWGLPLLRLDMGRIFGRFVGQSEAAMRRAIRSAEAVAPAVLWIDEIEKGFAGSTVESHDSGVSARVLGTFLTWLQEKTAPVFVVATANQIRTLPPELLRKGRFDELFFVDLPGPADRVEILAVHLRKRSRNPSDFDLPALAERLDGFTGAELEQVVLEGLYAAFADGRRLLRDTDLLEGAAGIVPLSRTLKETIHAMRTWAEGRARPAGP